MTHFKYEHAIQWLLKRGSETIHPEFKIHDSEKELVKKLLCYFLKDKDTAAYLGINLNKGILLNGPIGCGKTSLMKLMRFYEPADHRFILRSCRDISFEFIKEGYETISKYSNLSFRNYEPLVYCFDDLGSERNIKYYGNECNVLAEVLLSRYDLFTSRQLITHITTNLAASEIEKFYGNRVRSRLREQFNLLAFSSQSTDKRK